MCVEWESISEAELDSRETCVRNKGEIAFEISDVRLPASTYMDYVVVTMF